MTIAGTSQNIALVQYMRGLAALSVAWFHMTNSYDWGAARMSGALGWLGVDVFFVISGFVLPLSLWSRYGPSYRLAEFPAFMARRLVRIEPPYLVSVLLAAALWYASSRLPGFRGTAPDLSLGQLLGHVAYLPALLGYEWLQPVYWSLAYEFCFYIVLGLTFPLLVSRPMMTLVAVSAVALGLKAIAFGGFDGRILLFTLGAAVFLRRQALISTGGALTIAAIAIVLIGWIEDARIAVVAAASAILIWKAADLRFADGSAPHRALIGLGAISYSLYITHVLIGGRVVNLGRRFIEGEAAQLGLSALALLVAVAFAYFFWRWIERPFLRMSKTVVGGRRPADAQHLGVRQTN